MLKGKNVLFLILEIHRMETQVFIIIIERCFSFFYPKPTTYFSLFIVLFYVIKKSQAISITCLDFLLSCASKHRIFIKRSARRRSASLNIYQRLFYRFHREQSFFFKDLIERRSHAGVRQYFLFVFVDLHSCVVEHYNDVL